ncbi:hypothetical protein V1517DRAFT_210134 [Lipomyces orientalis]|uniref:Uncharacterized protein n=1 Tax=Lipomyces orientalis TaxID=1233043 RepID=A0ACC3TGQ9_9ASCO
MFSPYHSSILSYPFQNILPIILIVLFQLLMPITLCRSIGLFPKQNAADNYRGNPLSAFLPPRSCLQSQLPKC